MAIVYYDTERIAYGRIRIRNGKEIDRPALL